MALMHQWPSYLSRGPGADRCTYAPDVPLNEHERAVLDTACAAVPPPAVVPAVGTDSDYPDYVSNLLLTVLDLQLHNKIVYNAYQHYRIDLWGESAPLTILKALSSGSRTTLMATGRPPPICGATSTVTSSAGYGALWLGFAGMGSWTRMLFGPGRMEATTNGTSPARSGTWDPLRTAGW